MVKDFSMLVQRNLQQLGGAGASFRPCCRHYPAQRQGIFLCSLHPAVSAFPERVVGSACASSFSRIAQRSLALRPAHSCCHHISWHALPGGFNHFVTSMIAPVTSGWSISPGGICTHWKTPPYHGAHPRR